MGIQGQAGMSDEQVKGIRRYNLVVGDNCEPDGDGICTMCFAKDAGRWVKFKDHERAIAALKSRFKEHTSAVGRFLIEMYQMMVDPLEDSGLKVAEMCELLLHQAREDREKLNRSPANFPADWNQDSSLETWFPLTAEEFSRTKIALAASQQQVAALEARNKELESALERIASDFETDFVIDGQVVDEPYKTHEWAWRAARAALKKTS